MLKQLLSWTLLSLFCAGCLFAFPATARPSPDVAWEIPGLRAALLNQEPPLQQAAVMHISRWDAPIVNPPTELATQIRALQTDKKFTLNFLEGLSAQSNLGESIQSNEPQLLKIIQTRDSSDRPEAIRLLARSPNRAKYRPLLMQSLNDPKTHIYARNAAAETLGQLGPVAIPDLLKVLRNRQEDLPLLTKFAQDFSGKAALAIVRLDPNQTRGIRIHCGWPVDCISYSDRPKI